MQIYIFRDGQQSGPYSTEDINAYLANGTLLPTDLAYEEGMTEWIPVSQISGVVMGDNRTVTPSLPSTPVQNGNKKKILIGVGASLGLLAVAAVIFFVVIPKENPPKPTIDKKAVSIAQAKLTEWTNKDRTASRINKHIQISLRESAALEANLKSVRESLLYYKPKLDQFHSEARAIEARLKSANVVEPEELLALKGNLSRAQQEGKVLEVEIQKWNEVQESLQKKLSEMNAEVAAKRSELPSEPQESVQRGIVAASTDLEKINAEHNQAIEEWYLSLVKCLHCQNELASKGAKTCGSWLRDQRDP